jgi:GLPGLI family protein
MHFLKINYLQSFFAVLIFFSDNSPLVAQDFQGKAYYSSKSTMDLGRWGAKMSEEQKKQIKERLKNRLEKTYTLTFNKEESIFLEDDKLDAISGATDSWGKNFTTGKQYKNVKSIALLQSQEFYGKQFLVKDQILSIDWIMGSETKQIGNYNCLKATALVSENDLTWYDFSWDKLRNSRKDESAEEDDDEKEEQLVMIEIEAWYTPQIPVSHGPLEYSGLPGLILEVNTGNTIILCSKIILNPQEKIKIEAPGKGKVVTKNEYQEIITGKMEEMRNMYRGRG